MGAPVTWTDAEVADFIAVNVMDWHKARGWWFSAAGHARMPLSEWSPCNVPKQALALFLGNEWPRRFAIVNANGVERTDDVAENAEWIEVFDDDATGVVCRIEKKLHKHPVCRAIGVAVCVAKGIEEANA